MTDVIELPPLAEAMTAADLIVHEQALNALVPGASVNISFISSGPYVSFHGRSGKLRDSIIGATWPEVITEARMWASTHTAVHRDNRIRAMALAIIDLTDQHGRCDRAMLTRREFSGAEVDDLRDAACQRASEMSANAPFSVEG